MTTIDSYRQAIHDTAYQMRRLASARSELTSLQHAIVVREAQTVLAGLEGSNEAQRKADLTLRLESDGDYRSIANRIVEVQHEVSDADAESAATRELCRLYRLEIAMTISEGAREGVLV